MKAAAAVTHAAAQAAAQAEGIQSKQYKGKNREKLAQKLWKVVMLCH